MLNRDLKLVLDRNENSGLMNWTPQFSIGVRRPLPLEPVITRDAFLKELREIDSEMDVSETTIIKAIDSHQSKPRSTP
jgi:hypothetical protein